MNIFITGISSGIGRATAVRLVKQGHTIWGIARRENELKKLSKELSFKNFLYTSSDISKKDDLLVVIQKMEKIGFIPHVVILNAAELIDDTTIHFDEKIFEKAFLTNFHAAIFLIDAFLKKGCKQFIALNTTSAFRPNRRSISYSASKVALSMTFRGLTQVYKNKEISFSTIYLGPVDTTMWEGKRNFLIAQKEGVAKHIEKMIQTKKPISYYPPLSTTLFRLTSWLPDSLFSKLSNRIMT